MSGRIITYETYKQFAKKYGIRLTTLTGKKRTMQQLANKIGISMTSVGIQINKYCKVKNFGNVASKNKKVNGKVIKCWFGIKQIVEVYDDADFNGSE